MRKDIRESFMNTEAKREEEQRKSDLIFVTVMAILGSLILGVLIFFIIRSVLSYKRRKREKALARNEPRPMKTGNITQDNFQYRGALVVDSGIKGSVRHMLDDSNEKAPLNHIEFDSRLNEIVDIGSNVEVLEVRNLCANSTE
ncbi:hypothetical protein GCK32_017171 [Trichostrongylus colubriformis]|uniref:Uncharacterized protein n=1 Tax=Trichostrongylus colubriformis TaxID=6319 RepID=A0AAN8F506_TRICO